MDMCVADDEEVIQGLWEYVGGGTLPDWPCFILPLLLDHHSTVNGTCLRSMRQAGFQCYRSIWLIPVMVSLEGAG